MRVSSKKMNLVAGCVLEKVPWYSANRIFWNIPWHYVIVPNVTILNVTFPNATIPNIRNNPEKLS